MLWTLLLACQSSGTVFTAAPTEPGAPTDPDPIELQLTVEEPRHLAYVGDEVLVSGQVNDPSAVVWVEGYRAVVGSAGRFQVTVPVENVGSELQRTLDIEAANPATHLRERVTVLSGADPLANWPGAITLRFTPTGVDHLAEVVEDAANDLDLAGTLEASLPDLVVGTFSATPIGLTHWPIVATMESGPDGLDLQLTVRKLKLAYAVQTGTFLGDGDVELGFDTMVLGAAVEPSIDASGIFALAVTDTTLELADPEITIGGAGSPALENLLDGALGGVVGTIEGFIDGLVSSFGRIELFGPIGTELDLLGTPIALSVDRLATDVDGIGVVLGVDLGTGTETAIRVPTADEAGFRSDLAVAVHEGIFQPILQSDLLDLLEQDLELGGLLAGIIGGPIEALPGGDDLPDDVEAYCLQLSLGGGRTVRMREGTEPLATIVLPEVFVDIGITTEDDDCADWLDLTLALEADLAVTQGTELGLGLRVVDGTVTHYATEDDWSEQEVVEGLGGLITALTGLLGGSLTFDLTELFGGLDTSTLPIGDLQLRITGSEQATNLDGEPIEGLRVLTLSLWD